MALNGLSQRQLAEASGLSESYLCELLKGDKRGSAPTFKKLADALGVRIASIVQEKIIAA